MGLCAINGVKYGMGYDDGLVAAWSEYWVGRTG